MSKHTSTLSLRGFSRLWLFILILAFAGTAVPWELASASDYVVEGTTTRCIGKRTNCLIWVYTDGNWQRECELLKIERHVYFYGEYCSAWDRFWRQNGRKKRWKRWNTEKIIKQWTETIYDCDEDETPSNDLASLSQDHMSTCAVGVSERGGVPSALAQMADELDVFTGGQTTEEVYAALSSPFAAAAETIIEIVQLSRDLRDEPEDSVEAELQAVADAFETIGEQFADDDFSDAQPYYDVHDSLEAFATHSDLEVDDGSAPLYADSAHLLEAAADAMETAGDAVEDGIDEGSNRAAALDAIEDFQDYLRLYGVSLFDSNHEFQSCTNTAVEIAAGDDAAATIEVLGDVNDFELGDLGVSVEMTHPDSSQLTLTLTSPEGTEVTLKGISDEESADLIVTFLDDSTEYDPTKLDADTAMAPEGPGALADFVGESFLGDWTLDISNDSGNSDSFDGVLDSVCLDAVRCDTPAPTDFTATVVTSSDDLVVSMSWENGSNYGSIAVIRDGEIVETLEDGEDSYDYIVPSLGGNNFVGTVADTKSSFVLEVFDGEGCSNMTCVETVTLEAPPEFLRGDVDGDGAVFPVLDALALLAWGFNDGDAPACMAAADVDGNGEVFPIVDSLFLLIYGFLGGEAPPDPGPSTCGPDPEPDGLGCEEYTGC